MIVGIYVITGLYGTEVCPYYRCSAEAAIGTSFWDTPILTFLRLENIPQITKYVPNKGLNEAFMAFGAVGLAFNIVTRFVSATLLFVALDRLTIRSTVTSMSSTREERRSRAHSGRCYIYSLSPCLQPSKSPG